MKSTTKLIICGWVATVGLAIGQDSDGTVVRVVPPSVGKSIKSTQEKIEAATESPAAVKDLVPGDDQPIADPGAKPGAEAPAPARPDKPAAENPKAGADPAVEADKKEAIAEEDGGFLIKDASINDIFQLLSKRGGKQYFHNNKLNTDEYKVTGHLNGDGSPLKQMEELAFQYGIRMYIKGNTVYAMMDDQLQRLPAKEWTYSLNYLRPTDIEQIKALIQPLLSPGRGIVNFEPKTNTIVVIDTMHHIEMIEGLLRKIDKPKGQIVVEVKILRVNSKVGQRVGVDWSSSLGAQGVPVDVIRSLNSVFGFPTEFSGSAISGGAAAGSTEDVAAGTSNIILTPFQMSGVLRALNDGNLVTQKSNPVVITEDNEKANIALIDRVPIITSTVNYTGNGGSTTTDEVRYKIDESDPIEPEKTREIGVTISLRPSLLPDGTIRMEMRPRNAQIVENITGPSGNVYPRVSEATIESIARIPDGNSLIVGGFFASLKSKGKNKVPILGDIPGISFFFKSKQTTKEQSSLVFVVTPSSYNPACVRSNNKTTARVRRSMTLSRDHDSVDERNPGPAHESNMRRTIRGMRTSPASRYPQR
ncbi:MAG: secretin N-terminal domain-containing protein [Akkermansiaceae bacterium]